MTARRPHSGRVAWITGSTSGIGLAIAERLASEGASIALHGSRAADEKTEALAARLAQAHGVHVRYYPLNLLEAASIPALAGRIAGELGPIGILVNNAGRQHLAALPELAPQVWDDMLALHLTAAFHTIRACVPAMVGQGWGRIINMASVSGLIGVPRKSAYVASKHALLGLTKSVALELARTPVTCNAICPGWVLTPLVQAQIDALAEHECLDPQEARQRLLRAKQPSGDFVTVQQVAALASHLASDAAAQVRGAQWNIDGGYLAT